MNQQDLNALTEFWHRETNHLNDSIDSALKSAQDDAYARGYRRGREDLIDIRKQRDELVFKLQYIMSQTNIGHIHDTASAALARVKEQGK